MTKHSPWGQDPSGLCYCADCSTEEETYFNVNKYYASRRDEFSDTDIDAIKRWLQMKYIAASRKAGAHNFMGTGRDDPFMTLWREYMIEPFEE